MQYDLSSNNPAVSFEYTAATDPTGTVYTPSSLAACPSGTTGNGASNENCPTDGVPYGMTSTIQYEQNGATFAGHAPFDPLSSGIVRVKNIAYNAENNNRPVDLMLTLVPDPDMATYIDTLNMSYNSPVMPYNNDVPATQFRLTSGGLVAVGYGGLPARCTSTGGSRGQPDGQLLCRRTRQR